MNGVDQRADITARLTAPDGPFPVGPARVRGVDLRVYTAAPDSIRDVLVTGSRWGDRPALTFEDERYSWSDYLWMVGLFAGALVERFDVRPGDRVAVAARNYPEWAIAFAATVSVGAVCVPLNAWWSAAELAGALADCGAAVVVADAERSALIQSERHRLPALRSVVDVRPRAEPTGDHTWTAILDAQHEGWDLTSVPIGPDDDATIMYTSGTTGTPKGAVATHRAHLSTMINAQVWNAVESELSRLRGEAVRVPPAAPTSLLVGPLFHVSALPRIISAAVSGTHLVSMYKWDATRAVELIRREGVDTVPGGVPTVITALLDEVERTGAHLPTLRSITSGGAPITSGLVARIGTVFDHAVTSGAGYGLTETCGPMVMIGSHDFFERPLAVGRPFPTTEIRVVDDAGRDVETGLVGEAWLRGPNSAYRYWDQQDRSFDADGWFHSGDLVRTDEQGFVYVVDRIKDVVIRAGENVYCAEVEDVLGSHPDVEECAVLGRPHEVLGEEVVAFVRLRSGSVTIAEDLRGHVRERMAAFKVPVELFLRTGDLPRNAVGKLLKRELRRQLAVDEIATASPTARPR